MAKLDIKIIMVLLAIVLIVTFLDDVDASRRRSFSSRRRSSSFSRRRSSSLSRRRGSSFSRRRSLSSSRRRRSSYHGSSRSTSSGSGLAIGLGIFGGLLFLGVTGFVIGYCCCRRKRRQVAGRLITQQPEVQYQAEYQTASHDQPPPYPTSKDDCYPYPTKTDMYPPPGEGVPPSYPPLGEGIPPGAMPYPAPYPPSDPNMPMYPTPGDPNIAYPTPQGAQSPPVAQPPQGNQLPMESQISQDPPLSQGAQSQPAPYPPQGAQAATGVPYPAPGEVPSNEQASAQFLPPPSYNDALKDNQGSTVYPRQ